MTNAVPLTGLLSVASAGANRNIHTTSPQCDTFAAKEWITGIEIAGRRKPKGETGRGGDAAIGSSGYENTSKKARTPHGGGAWRRINGLGGPP